MCARTVLTLSGIIISAVSLTACAGGSDSQALATAGEPVAETTPTGDGGGNVANSGLFAQSEDIFPDCEKLVELGGGLLDDMILASSEIISPSANSSPDPLDVQLFMVKRGGCRRVPQLGGICQRGCYHHRGDATKVA